MSEYLLNSFVSLSCLAAMLFAWRTVLLRQHVVPGAWFCIHCTKRADLRTVLPHRRPRDEHNTFARAAFGVLLNVFAELTCGATICKRELCMHLMNARTLSDASALLLFLVSVGAG